MPRLFDKKLNLEEKELEAELLEEEEDMRSNLVSSKDS